MSLGTPVLPCAETGEDEAVSLRIHALKARSHPLRRTLSDEMHNRKLPRFEVPARLLQLVLLVNQEEAAESLRHVVEVIPSDDPDQAPRFLRGQTGGIGIAWERHSEFVTLTLIREAGDDALFDLTAFAGLSSWLDRAPGQLIRGSQIRFLARTSALPSLAALTPIFSSDDLVICDVAEGRARIWTDFRLHDDGFGRLLIADQGLVGSEPHLLVQRVQELGNYRKMALLGLPLAQQLTPEVTALEHGLAAISRQLAERQSDDEGVLEELSSLSGELARIQAETRFRMSATKAYADLCLDRIRRLAVQRVTGFRSLADFTERRLLPAMRTCEAFSERLEDLSKRLAWTSALLRTRVEVDLAKRNRDLLASMDRRAQLQLRLQQTVEGLSIVAIAYYAVNLIGYVAKPLEHSLGISDESLLALAVPLVLATVAWSMKAIREPKEPRRAADPDQPRTASSNKERG